MFIYPQKMLLKDYSPLLLLYFCMFHSCCTPRQTVRNEMSTILKDLFLNLVMFYKCKAYTRIKGNGIILKSRRGSCKTIISQILGGNYICFRLFNCVSYCVWDIHIKSNNNNHNLIFLFISMMMFQSGVCVCVCFSLSPLP